MKIELFDENRNLQATVLLDRWRKEDEKFSYTVITPHSKDGYVTIALRDLNYFRERGEPIADVLENWVYDDVIGEITHFFPFQTPFPEEIPRSVARRGVGTFVLRSVMKNLLCLEGIRHFYVKNPADPLYNLLLNQRFREFRIPEDPGNEHLYKRVRVK